MKMKSLVFVALLALVGCATSAPVETGKNTYTVTVTKCNFCGNPLGSGLAQADKFCAAKGLVTTIRETNADMALIGNHYATVQFTCTDKAHQGESVLRPDNGVTTIESKP
jgi:hypothetical protein